VRYWLRYYEKSRLGFGLGIYSLLIAAAMALAGSFISIELEERKYRGKPPRFFRQTNI
jgi:hypothetical protein